MINYIIFTYLTFLFIQAYYFYTSLNTSSKHIFQWRETYWTQVLPRFVCTYAVPLYLCSVHVRCSVHVLMQCPCTYVVPVYLCNAHVRCSSHVAYLCSARVLMQCPCTLQVAYHLVPSDETKDWAVSCLERDLLTASWTLTPEVIDCWQYDLNSVSPAANRSHQGQ